MDLNFYSQPFHKGKYGTWVYDAKDNFVFQFETLYNERGAEAEGEKELQENIIFALNSVDFEPVLGLNLKINPKDPTEIFNGTRHLITIRGWGNLTGIGGHNFSGEKAEKIQDDFVKWFIEKTSEVI